MMAEKYDAPDLTFKSIYYGNKTTPQDLRIFLYRGASAANFRTAVQRIVDGNFGEILSERISLVTQIHDYLNTKIIGGGSHGSLITAIRRLREFFSWADENSSQINLNSIEEIFIDWSEFLIARNRARMGPAEIHSYQSVVAVGKILTEVLELETSLISKTRFRRPKNTKKILGPELEKKSLQEIFEFGHALCDVSNALTNDVVKGPLPIVINFRDGKIYENWLRLKAEESLKYLHQPRRRSSKKKMLERREAIIADFSYENRSPIINLRIEAELLIFISQTGMNLEQAFKLQNSRFRYSSYLDGYQVHRVYKGRRQGEVSFEIFSEYREKLEKYLIWRNEFFPEDEDGLLFPLIRPNNNQNMAPSFSALTALCKKIGIKLVRARALRKTRINWFLRQSKNDALTAEMHSHTEQTLIRHYETPSLHMAIVEVANFHTTSEFSPLAPSPGLCARGPSSPQKIASAPEESTPPDCISPAGCLFCVHQRDIDSPDHVWSLATYRHLKSVEIASFRPSSKRGQPHPAFAAIERLTAKLDVFSESDVTRQNWVREARLKVEEEDYHPRWKGFLLLAESKI